MLTATSGPKPSTHKNRWLIWAAIGMVAISGMACRLEFGVRPDVSVQTQPSTYANVAAANAPVLAQQQVSAPQPTPTLMPASTPTPASPVLVPTTTAARAATPTPGITPTATPMSLIPARYPPHRIIVPAIGLDAPVETAGWTTTNRNGAVITEWAVPEDAAGWHKNSALPGHGNNVVLSGHHNLGTEVFRDLVDLKVGDEFVLQADAYEYRYVVTDRFIVPERTASDEQRQQNAQWILPTVDERLTLVTCWPYTGNSHRLIVVAKPVSFSQL